MTTDLDRMLAHMDGGGDGWPDQPDLLVERFGARWTVPVAGSPTGPDRDIWLAQRRKWLGASDVAAVYGDSHYADCWDICEDKLSGRTTPSNTRMEAGNILEPALLAEAARQLGPLTKPDVVHGIGRLGANLDGLTPDHSTVVDAKFTARRVTVEDCPDFLWQLNAQAATVGATRGYIATVDGTREFRLVEFPITTELMVAAVGAAEHVMAHVDLGVHADPLAGPVIPRPIPKETAEVDPDLFARWKAAKAAGDEWAAEAARLRDAIGGTYSTAQLLTLDGRTVARITRGHRAGKPYWTLNDLTKNGDAA